MARSDGGKGPWRRWLMLTAAAAVLAGGYLWWQQQARRSDGQALFRGEQAMSATLAGQSISLPALASRCSNCHEARQPVPQSDQLASSPSAARTYASPLSAMWLQQARLRHGGPETVYDTHSLCQLLRTGVDPGMVMVSTVMPRYEASPEQCAALWAYLTSR